MIHVLYVTNCGVCKKVIKFFREHQIPVNKILLGEDEIEHSLLQKILELCPNGFEDIISLKTLAAKELKLDWEKILSKRTSEIFSLIEKNTGLLKRPIIIQLTKTDKPLRLNIGYDADELSVFLRSE